MGFAVEIVFKNIVKLYLAAIISVLGSFAIAENAEPVSIKQLNFDLAPAAVKEIAEIKFDCTWTENFCITEGTEVLLMHERAGKVDLMLFFCDGFNGCGFSQNELKASLGSNFEVSFTDKDNRLYCGKTNSKLHEMCVDDFDYGLIIGVKFLYPLKGHRILNFEDKIVSCAKTKLGAEICLQGNSIYFTRSTYRQKSSKEFWE